MESWMERSDMESGFGDRVVVYAGHDSINGYELPR